MSVFEYREQGLDANGDAYLTEDEIGRSTILLDQEMHHMVVVVSRVEYVGPEFYARRGSHRDWPDHPAPSHIPN